MNLRELFQSFRKNERGNALVEFAMIVPIMSMMFLGVVDAGRVIDANARLNDGVSAGLRFALSDAYASGSITNASLAGSGYGEGEASASYSMFCECPDGTALVCTAQCAQGYKRIFVQIDMNRTVDTLFSYPIIGQSMAVTRSGFLQVP